VNITVLVENVALVDSGLTGEHGLSLLIEHDGHGVLFDAGASDLVARNAEAAGLDEALGSVEAIVLSHGHYDHTGGLVAALRVGHPLGRTRDDAMRVVVRPDFFHVKVRRDDDLGYIGPPLTRSEFRMQGASFDEADGPTEILPDTFVTGEIEPAVTWEEPGQELGIEQADGSVVPDPFREELALAYRTGRGLVVLVGCAHRGIVNSVRAAQRAAGDERVVAVLGGAHLRSASPERIKRTVQELLRLEPELVALGHCTGTRAEASMARALGDRFKPLRAGATFEVRH